MNSKFRELVKNVKTQTDKEVQFLLDHGIDPSTRYSNIPMYYPDEDTLIILRGPNKNSPYFTNGNKVSPEDTVIIQKVKEKRIPSTSDIEGNFYNKEYSDKLELTVDEYKNKIYNNPRNEETKSFLYLKDLDTPEDIMFIQNQYKNARQNDIQTQNYQFNKWIKQYESEFDLDGLSDYQKTQALRKLYREWEKGWQIEDLAKSNITWKIRHQAIFELAEEALQKIKDINKRKELRLDLAKKQREWFKQGIDKADDLLKEIKNWIASFNDKQESILTELYPTNQNKPNVIKDPHDVKELLIKLFGIDADRFITVPIIKKAIYSQDKSGKEHLEFPEEYLKVISFPNEEETSRLLYLLDKPNKTTEELNELGKLSNYTMVRVQDVASPNKESFLINLKELGDLIKKPENQNNELDTIDFRLQGGNEFKTLNPGSGEYIDLPEEVIIDILKSVNKENWEWEDIDLVKYYKDAKRVGKSSPLLMHALNSYNTSNNKQFIIRGFNTKDGLKFKGFIPYSKNQKNGPSIGSKDKYKELMK